MGSYVPTSGFPLNVYNLDYDPELYIFTFNAAISTKVHRAWRTGLPVRSVVLKPNNLLGQSSMPH